MAMTARAQKMADTKARNARLAALEIQRQAEMVEINAAIRDGKVIVYRSAGSYADNKRVRYLYEGVPGTWMVDQDGAHWCLGCVPESLLIQARI